MDSLDQFMQQMIEADAPSESVSFITVLKYPVSQKAGYSTLAHNFAKCFKILSPADWALNMQ